MDRKNGHLPSFSPVLKVKVATKTCIVTCGFICDWPKTHFFFLILRKNIKKNIIYNMAEKNGFLARSGQKSILGGVYDLPRVDALFLAKFMRNDV